MQDLTPKIIKAKRDPGVVADIHNPSYLRGRELEDLGLRSALTKKFARPYLIKIKTKQKKHLGVVAYAYLPSYVGSVNRNDCGPDWPGRKLETLLEKYLRQKW
jgi:hypothetical protein